MSKIFKRCWAARPTTGAARCYVPCSVVELGVSLS
jgi:hypothetical protein